MWHCRNPNVGKCETCIAGRADRPEGGWCTQAQEIARTWLRQVSTCHVLACRRHTLSLLPNVAPALQVCTVQGCLSDYRSKSSSPVSTSLAPDLDALLCNMQAGGLHPCCRPAADTRAGDVMLQLKQRPAAAAAPGRLPVHPPQQRAHGASRSSLAGGELWVSSACRWVVSNSLPKVCKGFDVA